MYNVPWQNRKKITKDVFVMIIVWKMRRVSSRKLFNFDFVSVLLCILSEYFLSLLLSFYLFCLLFFSCNSIYDRYIYKECIAINAVFVPMQYAKLPHLTVSHLLYKAVNLVNVRFLFWFWQRICTLCTLWFLIRLFSYNISTICSTWLCAALSVVNGLIWFRCWQTLSILIQFSVTFRGIVRSNYPDQAVNRTKVFHFRFWKSWCTCFWPGPTTIN